LGAVNVLSADQKQKTSERDAQNCLNKSRRWDQVETYQKCNIKLKPWQSNDWVTTVPSYAYSTFCVDCHPHSKDCINSFRSPNKHCTEQTVICKKKPSKLYSIDQFLISEAGTIGINLTKLPQAQRCLISTVQANSVLGHHGIKEGDKILAPRSISGTDPDVYSLFINASKHCPLLFEVKCAYKPPKLARGLLLECHSFHHFIITKSGPLDIVLEMENAIVCVKSVAQNSLGDLYGLRYNDILCKPSTNVELH
jgi:hypothetical protein